MNILANYMNKNEKILGVPFCSTLFLSINEKEIIREILNGYVPSCFEI